MKLPAATLPPARKTSGPHAPSGGQTSIAPIRRPLPIRRDPPVAGTAKLNWVQHLPSRSRHCLPGVSRTGGWRLSWGWVRVSPGCIASGIRAARKSVVSGTPNGVGSLFRQQSHYSSLQVFSVAKKTPDPLRPTLTNRREISHFAWPGRTGRPGCGRTACHRPAVAPSALPDLLALQPNLALTTVSATL